jgi:hypothetical protein
LDTIINTDIKLTAHIWTSTMAVQVRLERPGSESEPCGTTWIHHEQYSRGVDWCYKILFTVGKQKRSDETLFSERLNTNTLKICISEALQLSMLVSEPQFWFWFFAPVSGE